MGRSGLISIAEIIITKIDAESLEISKITRTIPRAIVRYGY